ncbi:MAG TPA: transcription antitermination factor NusB [Longimicrobiales bacterium]|nr:transcription antitermination factor NusB [Longimicrobiales bacterium]
MTAQRRPAASEGRRAALRARLETERGRRLDLAFEEAAAGLDARERAFARELAYGVTRLRGRLDHLIGLRVRRGLGALDPELREALRLGAYQLLYMGGVPAYAAVSQAVEQARAGAGPGAAKLANAVLRRVGEAGDAPELFPRFETDPAGFLASWGSHPAWLVERWLARWPAAEVRALVEANNGRPALHLVPLDVDLAEAAEALRASGIASEPVGEGTRCLRVDEGTPPAAALAALPHAVVQDPAANLVVAYADVPEGTKVADVCAAPGGKALALADRSVYTLAADRSESRLRIMRENVRRTERRVGLVVADGRRPPLAAADVVLLDVPCTATGTLRRRPDARWRVGPDALRELTALQRELLEASAELVPPGGLLVYSTCSLEREENEDQADAFLTRHPDFELAPTGAVPARHLDAAGRLVVTPQATGFDGSFAARFRRRGYESEVNRRSA